MVEGGYLCFAFSSFMLLGLDVVKLSLLSIESNPFPFQTLRAIHMVQ
jgi:hypothetical protein